MFKQVLGYVPGSVGPAITSFAMIYAFTRILTPGEFGAYSLVLAVVFLQGSIINAIQVAVLRFYPAAEVEGLTKTLMGEVSALFYAVTLAIAVLDGAALWLLPIPPDVSHVAWIGLPLLVFRAVVTVNQAVNRSVDRMARFNWIECAHGVLGLALGLLFTVLYGASARSVLLGLLVAALVLAVSDLHLTVPRVAGGIGRLVNFTVPLAVASLTANALLISDRFIVGGLGSAEILGVYSAAISLVDRPLNLIAIAVSTATFSMVIKAQERNGRQAGRVQAGKSGIFLLLVCLPACAGLALISHNIAAVMVGPAFRDGVASLIPIVAVTAFARAIRDHFIDHAFHLSGRTDFALWSYAPAVVANVALNLVLVPRFGMMGAAWAALVCQTGALIVGWFVGQRVFPLWLPVGPMLRIVTAVLAMAVALWLVPFPLNWLGLFGAVGLGMSVFGVAGLIAGIPRKVRSI
jgi:O-antigen/teichoic acid export membrane protein